MQAVVKSLSGGRASVERVDGERVVVKTDLSGAELLDLERRLRSVQWEVLVEAKTDANALRRLSDLRGKR